MTVLILVLWSLGGAWWYTSTNAAWPWRYPRITIALCGPLVWASEWVLGDRDEDPLG